MPTTIDTLQIEIQSNSTSASKGIEDLAKSLGELKKNGTVNVAIKNLNSLSTALRNFTDASHATRSVGKLVGSLTKLKEVGSVTSIGNSLTKLSASLKTLETVNLDRVEPKIIGIAHAVSPLSSIKAGGIGTMVNALARIGKVTESLDDAKIDAFAERVDKLVQKLTPLSTQMTTIQAGLKGVNSSARSAGTGVRQMADDVDAASINFASFIYIVQEVVQWIGAAVQKFSEFMAAAIEWDGIAARFGRGFGSQAQETYDWILRLNEEMGINVQQFMQYSSIYANMLQGFGVGMEDARTMALGYTELTYDIWAGYNDVYKTFEEASEAVKSAIAGEVEPVRRAGFTIVESTLEMTAAKHGLSVSIEKATEAEKSYLRYLTLVDQAYSQNLVGTYATELKTGEGLMRTFSQQLKTLSQAFGSLFLPILVRVMPVLQAFVSLLTDAVRWIAGFFGVKLQEVDFSNYTDGAEAVDKVGESALGAGDALSDAAKAAKELKNATLGIDELNVISPPSPSSSSSGGAGGSGGSGGSGFDSLDIESLWDESIFKGIEKHVDAIKEKIQAWLPVIGTVAGALAGLAITSLLKNIGDAISEMGVLQKLLATVAIVGIEAMLVFAFADNYLESGNLLNLVGQAVVTAASNYLLFKSWGAKGIVLSLGISILSQLIALYTSLGDGTVTLSDKETWIQGVFTIFTGALGGLYLSKHSGIFPNEGFKIGLALTAALVLATLRMGAIESKEIESGSWEAWLLELGNVLTAALAGKFLGTTFYGAKGGPGGALMGVTAGLALNLLTTIWAKGEDFGDNLSDWINAGLTAAMVGLTAAKFWPIISGPLKNALSGLLPMIGTAVSTALGGLGAAVAAVGGAWAVAAIVAIVGILTLAIVDYDFTEIGHKIGEAIGKGIGAAVNWFIDIGKAIKDGFLLAWDWLVDNFDIDSGWDILALFSPAAWITKIVPKMIEVGKEVLPGLWKGIEEGWDNFWGNVGEFISGLIQGFKDGFEIKSPSKVFAEIGNFLIDGLWEGISNKVTEIHDNIKGFVEGIIAKVKEFFGIASPSTVFKDIGKFLIEGLWEGINSTLSWLYDKIKSFATGVIDKVKNFFGVHSPSTVFADIGGFLIDGLVQGLTNVDAILKPIRDMWNNAKTWWDTQKGNLASYTPSIGDIKSKLTSAWTAAKTWWDGSKAALAAYTPSIGDIKSKLSSAWSTAKTWWDKSKAALGSYTPSIGDIKSKLSSAWSAAKTWWDKSKATLASYTPSIGSISTKLSSAWSSAKTWWSKHRGSLSTYTPSIGSISTKLSSAWSSAKTWWSKKRGSLSTYTPSIGSITDKLKSAWSSAKTWWSKNVKLSIPSMSFKVSYTTSGLSTVKKAVVKALGLSGWPKLSFAANGGMFDMGSLIWAGERGPEVVANAGGGRTGVMNVDQMQDAVFEGVYAAILAASRASQGSGEQAINVYLDGKQITSVVEQRQRERGAIIMGSEVYAY